MLSIDYIQDAFESHYDVNINIANNKRDLQKRYGDCISFEHEASGLSSNSSYALTQLLRCFNDMQYLKIKDRRAYSCFDIYKVDLDTFTYGKEHKKLTRVLADVLSYADTMRDVCLYMHHINIMKSKSMTKDNISWYVDSDKLPQNIANGMKAVGPIPRKYQDDPLSMTPEAFCAWLGEQYAKAIKDNKQTYYIDFRPLASLIAGNGNGFGSCFGLPCYPYQEADCYNGSPSAYALCPNTGILYSLADDGLSLTGRAWLYFTPDNSLYFGRLYGDEMSKDVCIQAAQLLGYDAIDAHYEPGSVRHIANGDVYLSDQLAIGFGPCTMDYSARIELYCHCIACGDSCPNDNDCLCVRCKTKEVRCAHCDSYVVEEESIYIEGVGLCCADCVSYCDDCGDYVLSEEIFNVGGRNEYHYVCQSCLESNYTLCEDCGAYVRDDRIIYLEGMDKHVCENCFDNYTYCEQCETYSYNENMITCDDCGEVVCRDCIEHIDGRAYCSNCAERIRDKEKATA